MFKENNTEMVPLNTEGDAESPPRNASLGNGHVHNANSNLNRNRRVGPDDTTYTLSFNDEAGDGTQEQAGESYVARGLFHLKRRAIACLLVSFVVWTFVTFIMTTSLRVCWSAKDELDLIHKFNVLQLDGALPLVQAHSHNDYQQPEPLWEALSAGFCSIEVCAYIFVFDCLLLN